MPHVDLLELAYFEGISIDALVSLVDLMEPEAFPKGTVILTEGQTVPSALFIATSGRVVITKRTGEGHERCLAEFDAPTLVGEVELFCQVAPVATVRAISPVSTFKLTRDTYDRLFEAHHAALLRFTHNVARVACHRLAIADEMLARVLGEEDLVKIRRTVYADLIEKDWPEKTGAFQRPVRL